MPRMLYVASGCSFVHGAALYGFSFDANSFGGGTTGGMRHLNPAVTLALFLRGFCTGCRAVSMLLAQLLAMVAACALLLFILPHQVLVPWESAETVALFANASF